MALKPVDKAAYAVVRTFIAAGAALYDKFQQNGGNATDWPNSDPPVSAIMDTIFGYVPLDAVPMNAAQIGDDPDCAVPGRLSTCLYLRGDVVFSPASRSAMIQALDARTPAGIIQEFQQAGVTPDRDLEWWAVALAAGGALFLIGGLPFAGALVFKIAGILLASFAAYSIVTPQTPGGKSIAGQWADSLAEGVENALKKAKEAASSIVVGLVALAAAYFLFVKD
jgi:hypothetical protein